MAAVRAGARVLGAALLVAGLLPVCMPAQGGVPEGLKLTLPLRIEGVAKNNGGAWPFWRAGFCLITVKRWSSEEDLQALRAVIEKDGQKGLAKAIQKMPIVADVGGQPMALATYTPKADGGAMLLFVMFRRTCNYNYKEQEHLLGAVQINLDAEGKGTGVLAGYTKVQISPDGGLHVEAMGKPCVVFNELKLTPVKK